MPLLEKLNIYGLSELEDIILAGLVTGDPMLLVGRHGSAKTMLIKNIAACLGMKFIAYDASKALFDDVIGFPNPKLLAGGVLDYIPTPISIWDKEFVLIDEISRANTSMQNKWLEIIRSRQIMGKKIPKLKYVFAAMNPPTSYSSAYALDPALSGRFAFIVNIPEVCKMNDANLRNIMKNISEDDAAALEHNKNNQNGEEIGKIIQEAIKIFPEISKEYDSFLSTYLIRLTNEMYISKIKLDGRRLGMIRRNCVAYLSIQSVKNNLSQANAQLNDLIFNCLKNSIPNESTGEPLNENTIMPIHMLAVKNMGKHSDQEFRKKVIMADNLYEMAQNYKKYHHKLQPLEHSEVASILMEKWKEAHSADEIIELFFAVKEIVSFLQDNSVACDIEICRRMFELFGEIYFITENMMELRMPRLNQFTSKEEFIIEYGEIAFALALNMSFRNKGVTGCLFNGKLYKEIKEKLMRRGIKDENMRT
ncbi:MAG: AAA domain (dynein-related subfamily) [Elusimicrobia bacterium ADurb.Bin231]|nr:MAG: AAA domain (dynein-related subfamily) [Elusimicrobia bacterium ADurb.Bin231]